MSNIQKERGQSKYYANKGLKRNKKPLRNVIYNVEVGELKNPESTDIEKYGQYRFKDEGFITLSWHLEGTDMNYWHGFITPENLKTLIGDKQWGKFCQGKREFITQRRIDGKNI